MTWVRSTLGEAIELFDHKRVPLNSRQRAARQGRYPYYGAQGIIDYVDDFLFEGLYLLVPEDGENLNSRKLPIAYFASGQFWVNNHAHILRARDGIADDQFLKHLLNGTDITGYVTGAAQPKLSQENLRRMPVLLPSLDSQHRIAGILSAYDDLIEVNTRRIAILEEMARRLFDEWFTRVGSNWPHVPLGSIAVVSRGRSYRGSELVDGGGVPFVNLKCIARNGGFRAGGIKRYSGDYKESHIVRTGDLVIAVTDMTQERRIVGQCGRVPTLHADHGVISMDLVKIRPTYTPEHNWLYAWLRWSSFSKNVREQANGVNVLHLAVDRITQHGVQRPTVKLTASYSSLVDPMFTLIDSLSDQNLLLSQERDLLLPKLISGEIDLSAAERVAGRLPERAAAE